MTRKLIINNEGYLEDLMELELNIPVGVNKKTHIESEILLRINAFNPKLKINKIFYEDLNSQFPIVSKGKYIGVIVEDNITDLISDSLMNIDEAYLYEKDGNNYCRNIIYYLFFTPTKEGQRNGMISQSIFPWAIDYIASTLDTSNYSISNHNVILINTVNERITSNMILKNINALEFIGIDYIEIFAESFLESQQRRDLKSVFNVSKNDHLYSDRHFDINFENCTLYVKIEVLTSKLVHKNNTVSFFGSSEKHYLMEVFPVIILAIDLGYEVDYTEYSDFCSNYKDRFSDRSDKFARCLIILDYINKYLKER